MNILISTTTNWNPGDDFIRYGVKNLLTDYFGKEINWIHYDRNPDLFAPNEWKMGSAHKSNVMNSDIDFSIIDMVVLAGSPEFIHGPLCNLYDGLVQHPEIPLLAIGIGYSFSVDNLELTENELKVLNRANTLILTRQYDLKDKLRSLLTEPKVIDCLPCPALFAGSHLKIQHDKENSLLIPQTDKGHQKLSASDITKILDITGNIKSECDFLCHYIEDFKEFGGYFSTEANDLLKQILRYSRVFSNRLHGGIPALGNQADVTFINSSNRVQKALEPYLCYETEGVFYMTKSDIRMVKRDYFDFIDLFLGVNK